eukprot:CAMPEP_0197184126 /NCGR_PEP_ID=MMETSP1423-20130617/9246_1 /TAXON_ID=476441 /ORGANISM="Pseudo-nitzschia heimii, Strain UNC1101" /LENGTH=440 /DNA_ID=CAMNT_0042634867 /DNA_START=216 /DNA_END=1538 /DNA_ORIENTATION=-
MTEERSALGYIYQSDQGETEDEEVKRNCVMGGTGMRDSDFSDGISDTEETHHESDSNSKNKGILDDFSMVEDRIGDLVKFVTFGSPIVRTKGLALHRPTAIIPSFASHAEKLDENDKTSRNDSETKFILSNTSVDTGCRFSPRSSADKDTGVSVSGSNSTCSSEDENKSVDDESIESGMVVKLTSLEFSFNGGEELSMEAGVEIVNNTGDAEQECCESSFDDQELHEKTSGGYALVGASGASVDDKWPTAKQKRVLSSNSLFDLNQDVDRNADLPKKMRVSDDFSEDVCAIPEILLDIEDLEQLIHPLPCQYQIRDNSLLILSDNGEEDMMFSEELEEKGRDNGVSYGSSSNLPILLLTPAESPRTVDETFVEQSTSSVEWPSNLVMDSDIIETYANVSQVSINTEKDLHMKTESMKFLPLDESPERSSVSRLRTISIEK